MYTIVRASFPPRRCLPAALLLLVGACTAGPFYSPSAEREVRRLKSKSLRLMEQAETPWSGHESAVIKLQTELTEARDAAATRRQNQITVAQWDRLLAHEGHLLGGFLARWEADSTLSPTFIVESSRLVGDAFEAILKLEQSKTGALE